MTTSPGAGPLEPDDVLSARFRTTKFTEGYDQDEVDDFLDRVVETLRARESGAGGPLTAEAVRQTSFLRTKFREGYSLDQVDDFLDRVATTLDGPTPPSAGRPAGATTTSDATRAVDPDPRSTPGLVPPARGWRRLFGG